MEELNRLFEKERLGEDIIDDVLNVFDEMNEDDISDDENQKIHASLLSDAKKEKQEMEEHLEILRHTLLRRSQRNFLKMMFSDDFEEQLDCALKITQLLKMMREEEE